MTVCQWKRAVLSVFLLLLSVNNCEWIQVPLRTHEPQFDLALAKGRIPLGVAEKLESLSISLRGGGGDRNHTKQLDLDLEQLASPASTTTTNAPKVTRVRGAKAPHPLTKKRISEPFSIFGFLRSIRDSFFFKAQSSVKQKVGFLEQIRDNVLAEIKRRVLGLFSAKQQQQRLSKRDLDSAEHGHDFVSADGALVTICFLTFSVFLIKLVLQIIYILKRKHYPMAGTGADGTVGAVRRLIKKNQNGRSADADAEHYLRIMEAINTSPN